MPSSPHRQGSGAASPSRSAAAVALLLAAALLAASLAAPPSAPLLTPRTGTALPPAPAGATPRHWWLELEADRYVALVLPVAGEAVELALRAPGGDLLAHARAPHGARGTLVLAAVTGAPGRHRLELDGRSRRSPGVYLVRPAEPADALLAEAEMRFAEAHLLASLAAEAPRRRALELFEGTRGMWAELGDVEGAFGALTASAELLAGLGEGEAALDALGEALALARGAARPDLEATALSNRGKLLTDSDRPAAALEPLDGALALRRRLADPAQPDSVATLARTLNNRGRALRTLGRLAEARLAYAEALELSRRVDDRELLPAILGNLAVVERLQGFPQRALELYEEALALARRNRRSEPEAVATLLSNLGTLYHSLGETRRAAAAWREALAAWEGLGDRVGTAGARRNLGWIALEEGDPAAAVALFEGAADALPAAPQGRDPHARERAATLYAVGVGRLEAGQPAAAAAPLGRAAAIADAVPDPPRQAAARLQLADANLGAGDLAAARRLLADALLLARRLDDPDLTAAALAGLGRVEWAAGRHAPAHDRFSEAVRLTETVRTRVDEPELRATFYARRRRIFDGAAGLLAAMARAGEHPGAAREALETVERARARSLAELLAERRLELPLDPALRRREAAVAERISSLQAELTARAGAGAPPAELGRLRARLEAEHAARRHLEREIRATASRYAALRYPEPPDAAAIQRALAPGTALLEYGLGERAQDSVLLVVTREGVEALPLGVAAEQVADLVGRLRRALEDSGRRGRAVAEELATALWELLLAPALPHLEGVERLVLVPDRALHHLPFEVLAPAPGSPAADGGAGPGPAYLVGRWPISYAPSAAVLAGRTPADRATETWATGSWATGSWAAANPELVVFADPVLPLRGIELGGVFRELPPLAGARDEALRIAQLFPADRVVLYLGAAAREERVKADPRAARARRLHFATHGLLSEDEPDLSSLVLGAGGPGGDDGLLQVHEIFGLRLDADLVVLSACDSGQGRLITGEGLVGLARAFLYAGAGRLAVSQWAVSDRSTASLMTAFYRRLDPDSGNAAEALRAAKLEMIERGDAWSQPYHWASFLLVEGG